MFSGKFVYELHGPKSNITLLPQTDGSVAVVEGMDFMECLPEEISSSVVADHRSDKYLEMVRAQLLSSGVTINGSADTALETLSVKGSKPDLST